MAPTGVYLITNRTDGKIYVGSAAVSFKRRWNLHRHLLRAGRHDNRHLQSAWNRDGEQAFQFSILVRCAPVWCLAMEQLHIARLAGMDDRFGYNLALPGRGFLGRKHSEETRKKLRDSHTGYIMPEAQKDNISRTQRGRKVSSETLAKRKATLTSPEYLEKQRRNALAIFWARQETRVA